MSDIIKYILAGVVGLGAFLFGDCTGLFWALIALIITDYITGVIVAVVQKKLSSSVGAKGIAKKVFMFAIVIVANLIDVYIIKNGCLMKNITILFYISNECISIVENGSKLGVPFPKKLIAVLEQLKKEND